MPKFLRSITAFLMASCALVQSGCASLPDPVQLPESHAWGAPQQSALLASVARPAGARSGFRNLISAEEALAVRLALADRAEHTLDLQYYAIHQDGASMLVIDHVVAAARRGVRVRVLVDDMNTTGTDGALAVLMAEPRIEVRLYNPFPSGRFSTATRILASLTDIDRINRRMHNKLFVADNAIAITGGRNLGNEYFDQDGDKAFVDLDILVAGPAVRRLSASFDSFWNHKLAYPAAMFVEQSAEPPERIASAPADAPAQAMPPAPPQAPWPPALVWAPGRVVADSPTKLENEGDPAPDETFADDLESLMRTARSEVLLISPYFVPGQRAMAVFRELRGRGVEIHVLTNSLASTDAPAAHVGYSRYRKALLEAGVVLHELRASREEANVRIGSFRSAESKLHIKAAVIDRSVALVGSMNFDPRSVRLNTELGVLVSSPALSGEIVGLYDRLARDESYRLVLDATSGGLRWIAPEPDGLIYTGEPGVGAWTQIIVRLMAPIAPEEWL